MAYVSNDFFGPRSLICQARRSPHARTRHTTWAKAINRRGAKVGMVLPATLFKRKGDA